MHRRWVRRREPEAPAREGGFTLVEVMAALGLVGVVLGSMVLAMASTQGAFLESQIHSRLTLEAQSALDRIVGLTGQALTSDALFTPLRPSSGVNSRCLRFRLVQSIDPATGTIIYDNLAQVYVYGPAGGLEPTRGVVIGRGPSLTAIYLAACGPDAVLGTDDDNTQVVIGTTPMLEVLLSGRFAPQTGEMFTVDVAPAPVGRLITFTLRLNARRPDGRYILQNDLVLSERVALRQ